MEKSYSETEQNMSEKQGKGQIMLHLPMKFKNHAMNFIICICQPYSSVLEVHVKWFLNELLVSLIMPLLSSKSVDEKINQFFFIGCLSFWR
jgi:hypothetical protein